MSAMNESEVIQRTIDGDIDSYAELVTRYHIGLIIHCEQLVKDRDEAEDIAQEAFIKAYKNLKKFNATKSKFSTWLYKIATNLALDHLRKQKHIVHPEDIELLAETTQPVILENERKDAVRRAVDMLEPPEYKEVIEAYYWRGMSYDEIAESMHKPVNTIGTYIRRAKQQLKGELLWLK
jgi:RNA polymerase sigma-70 factor (ECF subfamily)